MSGRGLGWTSPVASHLSSCLEMQCQRHTIQVLRPLRSAEPRVPGHRTIYGPCETCPSPRAAILRSFFPPALPASGVVALVDGPGLPASSGKWDSICVHVTVCLPGCGSTREFSACLHVCIVWCVLWDLHIFLFCICVCVLNISRCASMFMCVRLLMCMLVGLRVPICTFSK